VSRGRRRHLAAAGLAAALLLLAAAVAMAACGAGDDPFTGLWWEPATARRIEITKDGDQYRLLYGAARRPYQATREGDELRVRQPIGDGIVVKAVDDRRLTLLTGGKTSRLVRVPQHQ
jgi:hypothetical protein